MKQEEQICFQVPTEVAERIERAAAAAAMSVSAYLCQRLAAHVDEAHVDKEASGDAVPVSSQQEEKKEA